MPCSECVIAVIDFDCFMGKHLISNTFYVYNISKQKYVCTCCVKKNFTHFNVTQFLHSEH